MVQPLPTPIIVPVTDNCSGELTAIAKLDSVIDFQYYHCSPPTKTGNARLAPILHVAAWVHIAKRIKTFPQ